MTAKFIHPYAVGQGSYDLREGTTVPMLLGVAEVACTAQTPEFIV